MPLRYLRRLVAKHLPTEYRSSRWPTTDQVVPAALFGELLVDLWSMLALEQVNTARAIGLALSSADSLEAKLLRRRIIEQAFPER